MASYVLVLGVRRRNGLGHAIINILFEVVDEEGRYSVVAEIPSY